MINKAYYYPNVGHANVIVEQTRNEIYVRRDPSNIIRKKRFFVVAVPDPASTPHGKMPRSRCSSCKRKICGNHPFANDSKTVVGIFGGISPTPACVEEVANKVQLPPGPRSFPADPVSLVSYRYT